MLFEEKSKSPPLLAEVIAQGAVLVDSRLVRVYVKKHPSDAINQTYTKGTFADVKDARVRFACVKKKSPPYG